MSAIEGLLLNIIKMNSEISASTKQKFEHRKEMVNQWDFMHKAGNTWSMSSTTESFANIANQQESGMNFPPDFKLSVLMPVYNERNTIQEVIARVQAVAIPKEIIIVDDGSTDGTCDILRQEVI